MIFSRLHRLRLRLGLFRAKNYATITIKRICGKPQYLPWWQGQSDGYAFSTYRQAVRHIRRQVRLGVRP